jgi:hypothetical protein
LKKFANDWRPAAAAWTRGRCASSAPNSSKQASISTSPLSIVPSPDSTRWRRRQGAAIARDDSNAEKSWCLTHPKHHRPASCAQAADACLSVLQTHSGDPLALELFEPYFDRLYYGIDLDTKGIVRDLTPESNLDIRFRTAAENFRLIDDEDQAAIFVRYANHPDIDMLLLRLEKEGPERWLMRKLQRYAVNIPRRQLTPLLARGDVNEVRPGCYVQRSNLLYDAQLGLLAKDTKTTARQAHPMSLIAP